MRRFPLLLLALVPLALLPLGMAGSVASPEISDGAGDADQAGALDITAVWVDGSDPLNVTFHVVVPKLPEVSSSTGQCADAGCAGLALSFAVEFAVLAPDGTLAPTAAGYNHTYAVYRHGAPAGLRTAIGSVDADGKVTFVGAGSASVGDGGDVALRLPRNSTAINLPAGAEPGAYRLNRTFAYSTPELCTPESCVALEKPQPAGTAVKPTAWDTAPDTGYGADFVYPAPADEAAPVDTTTSTSATATSTTSASHPPPGTTTTTSAPAPGPASTTTASSTAQVVTHAATQTTSKASPALGVLLLAGAVAAVAAVRRRLA